MARSKQFAKRYKMNPRKSKRLEENQKEREKEEQQSEMEEEEETEKGEMPKKKQKGKHGWMIHHTANINAI